MNNIAEYFKFKIRHHSGEDDPNEILTNTYISFQWGTITESYQIDINKYEKDYHIRMIIYYDKYKYNEVYTYSIAKDDIYNFIDWLFTKLYPKRMY